MKVAKRIVLGALVAVLIILIATICQTVRCRGIYVGMPYDVFIKAIPEEERVQIGGYAFFRNSMGGHIVAYISREDQVITDIHCYDHWSVNPTDAEFSKIKKGMSVEQVVSIVGIPYGQPTFGMTTLGYKSDSGTTYLIYMDQEDTDDGIVYVVQSVHIPQ